MTQCKQLRGAILCLQVLADAKAKKEEAFQEGWKTMKQGKNKPLDADEIEFLDQVEDAKLKYDLQLKQKESAEIDSFRLAVAQQSENKIIVRQQPQVQPHRTSLANGSLFAVNRAKPKKVRNKSPPGNTFNICRE